MTALSFFRLFKKRIQMVGVGGLIINSKNEVLLTKRIEKKFPRWNGCWGLPGGHVEFGEDPTETLRREMREELNIEIKLIRDEPFVVSQFFDFKIIAYHGILLAYVCKIAKGSPRKTSPEHTDCQWFKPENINFDICIPSTEDFIKKFLSH